MAYRRNKMAEFFKDRPASPFGPDAPQDLLDAWAVVKTRGVMALAPQTLVRAVNTLHRHGVYSDLSRVHFVVSTILPIAEHSNRVDRHEGLRAVLAEQNRLRRQKLPRAEKRRRRRELSQRFDRLYDEMTAEVFEEFGERELAAILRTDRRAFDDLVELARDPSRAQ